MARLLSQTLHYSATSSSSSLHSLLKSKGTVPSCVTIAHRHRSSQPSKPQFLEIDLTSSSSPSAALEDDGHELALKKFDDLLRRILVQKATPDWLPFSPGSSFWVPPLPTPSEVIDLAEKLSNELSDEESLSGSNFRGWPCSNFFLKDLVDADVEVNDPEKMEVKVEVKVLKVSNDVAHSEDEEG
ncbi:hypothetical protein L6164_011685 [Bauhinia variegata]|uniref:Uncharacterized protein n=1 Tax=Bauhinia variegata TaxID=167791 RepID=A0ACB9P7P3_BAUVA|nr:hypothetical protein L6164_011685 [Bauhinia variegata]